MEPKRIPLNLLGASCRGDPLLPFIFIMAFEYLYIQIQKAVSTKLWKPFKIRSHNLKVSHLLFADDILLFVRADNISLQTIKIVLNNFYFCNTSGMEINFQNLNSRFLQIWRNIEKKLSLTSSKSVIQINWEIIWDTHSNQTAPQANLMSY